MKPAAFEYERVGTVAEAIEALARDSESRVLAGGQSLVPLMNLRLARPNVVVDVSGIADLDDARVADDSLTIGALHSHRSLERSSLVATHAPLMAQAASHIGHVAIRNRGTLGGSISHADPAAELPAALVALEATVVVAGPRGGRRIAARDFFTGYFSTALAAAEMVTAVEIASSAGGDGCAFVEVSPRPGDYAIAGVAAVVDIDADGACAAVRAAACGLGDTPLDLSSMVSPLVGERDIAPSLARSIARQTAASVSPVGDIHASADDRRELAQLLVVAALRSALADARAKRVSEGGEP